MIYAIHVKIFNDTNGWEEVESYNSYNDIPDDDKDFFDWLLAHGESVVIQGNNMWEIRG